MFTAVKICGITKTEHGLAAAHAGAHAIGLVFAPRSPRRIASEVAQAIALAMPPFVTTVGLFADPPAALVNDVLEKVPLQMLQFHGDETPEFCRQFGLPYLKAVRVKPGIPLLECARRFSDAKGLLLDAFVEGNHGGTGASFDWNLIPARLTLPIVLAGGLTPDNVGAAIRAVRPWAVDVSSGVEQEKGVKDPVKIAAFMEEVRNADVRSR
ncbi:MAG: phosphoribosylanthranilate isomerase [Betaproteobacteria bacterium]|nr:phosphoribosylanthranilate isomerase [Betaproteobacteria bacterium]